jgi:hypothetical protein
MDRPIANSYWVVDGRFLAGEYPLGRRSADDGAERIQDFVDAGIDMFIDLTEPGECPPYDGLLPEGIDYHRSPIPDAKLPQLAQQMRALQREIAAALAAGKTIYVHCRAGIGRTGTTVGCYLVEQGLSGEAALTELNRLWQFCARSVTWPEIPQTGNQANYILGWPELRLAQDAAADTAEDAADSGSAVASGSATS